MSKIKEVLVHSVEWNSYDQIYKITWKIDGKLTNAFSTRGKRIGQTIAQEQKNAERLEAEIRGEVVCRYLLGSITRSEAIKTIEKLKFLCPKNPTAHLCTMNEIALENRATVAGNLWEQQVSKLENK